MGNRQNHWVLKGFLVLLAIVLIQFDRQELRAALPLAKTPEAAILDYLPKNDHHTITKYNNCIAAIKDDAIGAVQMAEGWQDEGGDIAATHCLAIALYHSGKLLAAASLLNKMAHELNPELATDEESNRNSGDDANSKESVKLTEPARALLNQLRSQILSQAASLYNLSGDLKSALTEIDAAIKLAPQDPELWIDRAIILSDMSLWTQVVTNLNQAIKLNGQILEARFLRAVALRHLKEYQAAQQELDAILIQSPHDNEARLERGIIFYEIGEMKLARQEWIVILKRQESGEILERARYWLNRLEN